MSRDVSEPVVNNLIAQIESAFAEVQLGDGRSLHQARALDDCKAPAEIAAVRRLDTETRWQEIPDQKIQEFGDTLTFMDAEGLRFYLPRFMIWTLTHLQSGQQARDAALEASRPWWDTMDRRSIFSPFSQDQRRAVACFLLYIQAHDDDDWNRRIAEKNLKRFWRQFL